MLMMMMIMNGSSAKKSLRPWITTTFTTSSRIKDAHGCCHVQRLVSLTTDGSSSATADAQDITVVAAAVAPEIRNGVVVVVNREDILHGAAALTKSLYRRCLRSVQVIRWGNEFDEMEFAKREEEFRNPSKRGSSGGGGILSMSPPPNREDELRSRAAYYHSYARECFTQESDCLDNDPLQARDIHRYLYYLRKGDKDRQWLLADMMFQDPYHQDAQAVDHQARLAKFEAMTKQYLGKADEENDNDNQDMEKVDGQLETANNGFDEDEDPEWFQKKFPHLR